MPLFVGVSSNHLALTLVFQSSGVMFESVPPPSSPQGASIHQALNGPPTVRTYDVERKILNLPEDSAPSIRQQGDTTIHPVVKEQMILTKLLVLMEEIHVTRKDGERIDTQVVTLNREHLDVVRESILEKQTDSTRV